MSAPPSGRWPVAALAAALWPLAAGAAGVNLFFLTLLGRAVGLDVLDPVSAAAGGAVLGVPAAWWFARRMRRLMDEADSAP
jgi:hypothetical protein